MSAPTPYEQTDFSGGFTDNYFSNNATKCARNDNLNIDNNQKLVQRPGGLLFSVDAAQLPSGSQRMGRLFKYIDESAVFAQSGSHIYRFDAPTAAWVELTGPSGNQALPILSTTANVLSITQWQGHILGTSDAGGLPFKIYNDSTGTWQIRTAGLPTPATPDNFVTATVVASMVTLANDIRTQFLHHVSNDNPPYNAGLPHASADSASAALVAAAATDLPTLITLTNSLVKAYIQHNTDLLRGYTYHLAPGVVPTSGETPTASLDLDDTSVVTVIYGLDKRLNDLKLRHNYHQNMVGPHFQTANTSLKAVVTASNVYGVDKGAACRFNWQPWYDWGTVVKARFNSHLADGPGNTHAHSTLADAVNPITATSPVTTDSGFVDLLGNFMGFYTAHNADAELAAAWVYHAGQNTTPHLLPISSTYVLAGIDPVRLAVQVVEITGLLNAHTADLGSHFVTNPSPYTNKWIISGGDFRLASYAYAIIYSYTYTVGNVTFEDVSTPYFFAADPQLPVEISPLSIIGIPALANTTDTNYDTANIVVKIYRTTDGGTVYFYAGQVTNGTTTYSDALSDVELGSRPQLYMTGGVVANDSPPPANCVHITGNKAYYGYITDTGQTLKTRIVQSIDGDIDSVPGSFFENLDDAVVGISSVRTVPVILGQTGVYRIEGEFDLQGNGGMTHVAINNPDGIGCVSENSIIRIDSGVFFAGTDGFYFTDGYQIQKISADWNTTYQKLVQTPTRASRITGSYDKYTKRVQWGAQLQDTSTDNDTIFSLDLQQNFPSNVCWSTWSNGAHFAPTALLLYQSQLLRGDSRGYLFSHHPDHTEDAYVNVNVSPALWGTKTIIPDFKSCASDLGMGPVRKIGLLATFNFKNESNLSCAVVSDNDDGLKVQNMSPIKSRTHITWGDPYAADWGVPNLIWDFQGNLSLKRRFVAQGLRFTYKQLELTSLYCLLKESGTTPGSATVSDAAQTATLDVATNVWPADLEGQFIKFSGDSYQDSFEILSRVSDTVLLLDHSPEVLLNGSQSWQIWGYPKYEKFHLLSYAVHAMPLSTSQLATKTDVVGGVD